MPDGEVATLDPLNALKEKTKEQAEELVAKDFPRRICALNDLLADPRFNLDRFDEIHSDVNIPMPDPAKYFPDIVGSSGDGTKPPQHQDAKRRKSESGGDPNGNSPTSSAGGAGGAGGEVATVGEPPRTIPGTKIYLLPNGVSACNAKLGELMDLIKPLLRQLVDDANTLKMWVSFLIPKIEDGNNFGVSIQEETLGEIRAVESEAASFYDGIARYFSTRASIISKIIKFPHVEDYRQVIRELDEKEYFSLRLVLLEVRNHYALLHDIITKNLDKIRKPRTQHVDALY